MEKDAFIMARLGQPPEEPDICCELQDYREKRALLTGENPENVNFRELGLDVGLTAFLEMEYKDRLKKKLQAEKEQAQGTAIVDLSVNQQQSPSPPPPSPQLQDTQVLNDTLPATPQTTLTAASSSGGGNNSSNNSNPGNNNNNGSQPPPAAADAPPAPQVNLSDLPRFSALDIRVGEIVEIKPHPDSTKLYIETIDLGPNVPRRTIVSGLAPFFPDVNALRGKKVLVLANLKPRNLAQVLSEGMVLVLSHRTPAPAGADPSTAQEQLEFPLIDASVPNGERISIAGEFAAAESVLNPKKKIWEKLQPHLSISANKAVSFLGKPLTSESGLVTILSDKLSEGSLS